MTLGVQKQKTIFYLANVKIHHTLFNLPLMLEMKKRGYKVIAMSAGAETNNEFKKIGIKYINWHLDRGSKNIFQELKSFRQLVNIFKKIKPEIIQSFTIKANIYATLAARKAGVKKVINTVTGLGYIFTEKNWLTYPFRFLAQRLYLYALNHAWKVIFFNPEDQKLIGKMIKGKKVMLPSGAGINLEHFKKSKSVSARAKKLRKNLNIPEGTIVILTVCRLLKHKGIIEYLKAGKFLAEKYPDVYFLIAGEFDEKNPSAIRKSELERLSFPNLFLLGQQKDIRTVIAACDIFVLASYREGMPRSILEAMAMAKPVITTFAPGCNQTVIGGYNGYKVKVGNWVALSRRIEELIADKKKRLKFGKNSRLLAEEKFSDKISVKKMIKIYQLDIRK